MGKCGGRYGEVCWEVREERCESCGEAVMINVQL